MKAALAALAVLSASVDAFAADPSPYLVSFPDATSSDWVALSEYQGKVVLIDVVGATCGWTDREQPALLDLYEKHHASGLEIVSVLYDTPAPSRATVDAFRKRTGIPWKIVQRDLAFESVFRKSGGYVSFPTNFLVTRNGVIKKLGANRTDRSMDEVREAVETALAEPVTAAPVSLTVPDAAWAKDLRGKPFVVAFFRDRTCDFPQGLTEELVRTWKTKGVSFVGVDVAADKNGASLAACTASRTFPFPVSRTTVRQEPKAWLGANTEFAVLFVDARGNIRMFTTIATANFEMEANDFPAALELITRNQK